MIWENSSYLWFLLLLPVIYGGYFWYKKYQIKKRSGYFDDRLINQLRKNYWKTGEKVRLISLTIAAALFIIALAGPKIGTEVREVQRKGVNLLVALDLSRSMNAEDVRPSRLDKAKFELNRLINRLQGDRVGLLVFTDEAFVQVPFTTDYSAFRMLLDISNTEQMPSSGTNFHSAIQLAKETFRNIDNTTNAANVLLFVADGENHGPSYQSVLRELINEGVTVFSVGIGTREGGPIPIYNQNGQISGYHRDAQGNTVTTRLGSESMEDIARQGGGEYYEIRAGSDNIEPFFSKLDELERGEFSTQEFADYKNQYQFLLFFGMLFFMVTLFFPDNINEKSILNRWLMRYQKNKVND
ncbi:MAG: VWA domain-containing protein [Balneolaceae bacterium]|nr:VWA domain-containing protein [Balneolaceae bacterium]